MHIILLAGLFKLVTTYIACQNKFQISCVPSLTRRTKKEQFNLVIESEKIGTVGESKYREKDGKRCRKSLYIN